MSASEFDIPTDELLALLERNRMPAAAERIAAGEDRAVVLAGYRGTEQYDDGEGRWLAAYIEHLCGAA